MNTTLLFVELLITGIQSMVWVSLLVLTVFGYEWLAVLTSKILTDFSVIVTSILISFAYSLGVIFDRVSDHFFHNIGKAIGKQEFPEADKPISVIRFNLGKDNPHLNTQIEYTRTRIRISRSSSLNIGLITIFAILFVLFQVSVSLKFGIIIFILLFGGVLSVGSFLAWKELSSVYARLIKTNYQKEYVSLDDTKLSISNTN